MNNSRPIYLPGLNGIRALAALAVVVSHVTQRLDGFGLDPLLLGSTPEGAPRGMDLAGFGVSVFFVLSGFLITFLLLKEQEQGPIQIKKFYVRRALRIWPLYYLYMGVAIAVVMISGGDYPAGSTGYYILLAANVPAILGASLPFLAHYWSLGVEEQFYLAWPWACRVGADRLFRIAIVGAAVLVGVKASLHVYWPGTVAETAIHVTRVHCMLLGAAAAVPFHKGSRTFIGIVAHPATQALAWGVMAVVATNRFHVASFLDQEIVSLVAVAIIVGQATGKSPISLETPVLNFLGRRSYGIYVVHPLVIAAWAVVLRGVSMPSVVHHGLVYGTVLASTVVVAHLSFRYFERPFLALKAGRFSVVKSSDLGGGRTPPDSRLPIAVPTPNPLPMPSRVRAVKALSRVLPSPRRAPPLAAIGQIPEPGDAPLGVVNSAHEAATNSARNSL